MFYLALACTCSKMAEKRRAGAQQRDKPSMESRTRRQNAHLLRTAESSRKTVILPS